MSNVYHVTTQLGRMDSFFLEADSFNDVVSLIELVSEADIVNIKKVIFSKNFKIGTIEEAKPVLVFEDTIYKWSFFCFSNNHSKQIDLYNLKPHTKKEDIEKFLKTQMIVDEPIIGFYDDTKTDFRTYSLFSDNLYQVVYKYNSRTYNENFYSNNVEELKRFFDDFVGGELIEIREFEISNISDSVDDGEYHKRVSLSLAYKSHQFKTFIPNIKKNIDFPLLQKYIFQYLKFNNKKLDDVSVKLSLKS